MNDALHVPQTSLKESDFDLSDALVAEESAGWATERKVGRDVQPKALIPISNYRDRVSFAIISSVRLEVAGSRVASGILPARSLV